MLSKRDLAAPVVSVLGLTFKENIPDTRNSKVVDIVRELARCSGSTVQVSDPWASPEEARREYGIELIGLDALRPADAVILAVAHEQYVGRRLAAGDPVAQGRRRRRA